MSFDLFLNSFSRGQPAPANRDRAEAFLAEAGARVEAGRLIGTIGDGTNPNNGSADAHELFGFVQWRDGEPWTGGAQIIVRSLNKDIVDFVYGFAEAARLAICNPQFELPEPMWMLPPFVSPDDLPSADRTAQPFAHVKSGHELAEALVNDFTSFEAIQNAVSDLFGDE